MPASDDKSFYEMLNSIKASTGDEDAIRQNKRIKEAEFAEDSREPTAEEEKALKAEVIRLRNQQCGSKQDKHGDETRVNGGRDSVLAEQAATPSMSNNHRES